MGGSGYIYGGQPLGGGHWVHVLLPLVMTDSDEDYRSMTIAVRDELQDTRADWEPVYAKLTAEYEALDETLTALDTLGGPLGTGGFTTARMKAEQEALDASVTVLNGVKAVQLDAPRPELGEWAKMTRTKLDELRDTKQVDKMRALLQAAHTITAALADELVTADHLTRLDTKVEALAKLVGSPRKQVIANTQITAKERELLAKLRTAIDRLDTRVPNLKSTLPEVVKRYQKARKVIKLGGRGKKDKETE